MGLSFLERIQRGDILVADGAMGTNLQAAGLGRQAARASWTSNAVGFPPEEWVSDEPEKVLTLHRAFIDAGADVILTNSFGGTRIRMRKSKYADRVAEINCRAAQLAREAVSTRDGVFVAGSMGPTGILMQPFGELTHADVVNAYAEQAAALTEGGVDLLLLETFFALEEATAAIEGVKQTSPLPLVVSFSYDQGARTMRGLRPAQVVQTIAPLGIAALGSNCGKTLHAMEQVVNEMADQKTGLPIWAKPNAGLPRLVGDVATYAVSPEMMGEYAVRYVKAGAQIVGGCCGSTPAHVAAIARAVRSNRRVTNDG